MMTRGSEARKGKFELFEIEEPSLFDKKKSKYPFIEALHLTVGESEFLFSSLLDFRHALIIVADRRGRIRIVLTALYRMFRVLITFSPSEPMVSSELYRIRELWGTVYASPRAIAVIKENASLRVDCSDILSRLLNLNVYLAKNTEVQRSYHDMIDAANLFAAGAAFLSGTLPTFCTDYPEPIFPVRFDCALLGLILIAAFACSAEYGAKVHIKFLVHRQEEPFADILIAGEPDEHLCFAANIMGRLGMPIRISSAGGVTRVLACPIRPDVSVLELKNMLILNSGGDQENFEDPNLFPQ